MSLTKDPHRASQNDTARPTARGSERTHRGPLARALAAVSAGALAIGALAAVNAASAPRAPSPAPSAAAPSLLRAPMDLVRPRAHRITKATIGLFTVTPAQLPAAGGSVRLVAVVAGATSCRFSSTRRVSHLPADRPCASGSVSLTVKLPKNTGASSRSFRFKMTASDGNASTTAAPVRVTEGAPVPAHGAPHITTQPTGRSVVAGATVTFTAAASGSPSVRWQLSSDGKHWSNVAGATSRTYSFTAAIADSGREYRAVFTNSAGATASNPATLIVTTSGGGGNSPAQVAPIVTLQPAGAGVTTGAVATFTAAASGAPAPGVQWQVSTDGGSSWAAIGGATSASYAFTAQLGQSGYEYRAVFSNAAGVATTNAATLTVSQAPVITSQPSNQSIVIGSSVTLTAAAAGSPTPTVQWQLSTNSGITWTAIPGATSTSYTFTPLQTGSQEYEAVFSNGTGTVTSNAATVTVTATTQPPAIVLQPANQTGISGQSVTFTAAASGSPTPTVQWQFSTNSGITWTAIAGATSTSYTFTASQSESGYEYEAVFTNGDGPSVTTNAATLTVQTAPQVTVQPSNTSVSTGTSASFSASASGIPAPTVQWQLSTNSGSTWSNIPSATASTYAFTTTLGQSGNEYRAVFTNAAGSATTSAGILTVIAGQTAPEITGQPSSLVVLANANVSFSASASGSPTPSVQWWVSMDHGATWSKVAGATSATLSFTASAADNGFEYEAVFTNTVSSATTSAATLVVGGADASSGNWSGYAATGATFTAVTGTWNVPAANCQGAITYSSQWVGIDGDTSPTVEQDGTDADCGSGTGSASYYAWYETYGAANTDPPVGGGNSVELPTSTNPVSQGDSMTGTVSVSGTTYTLAITDNTRHWSFSIPEVWSVPVRSSAEWIVERPLVGGSLSALTNFGTVTFSSATATTSGSPLSISALGGQSIEMTNTGGTALLALPGPLSGTGDGFTDTFYASN